jgi:hypothetical protein
MDPLAELAPKGAAEAIRGLARSAKAYPDPDPWPADSALVRLGDREAIDRSLARGRISYSGLRFVPSRRVLDEKLKGVPAGNPRALADYLAERAEAGEFMMAAPGSRVASPRFAARQSPPYR